MEELLKKIEEKRIKSIKECLSASEVVNKNEYWKGVAFGYNEAVSDILYLINETTNE